MHRSGICRVSGDTVVLDGTTMDELERYHLKTLRLALDVTNEPYAEYVRRMLDQERREREEKERHEREVDDIARRLRFEAMSSPTGLGENDEEVQEPAWKPNYIIPGRRPSRPAVAHTERNASVGLSLAARTAGYRPAIAPITNAEPIPAPSPSAGTTTVHS
jgi:hypothetical protein